MINCKYQIPSLKKYTRIHIVYIFALLLTLLLTQHPARGELLSHPVWQEQNAPVIVTIRDTLDGAVYIMGEVTISVPIDTVWNVLTDYENLKSFIPGILESSILSENNSNKIILQKGKSKFLFFSKTIEVKLRLTEQKLEKLIFDLIEGPFHIYRGEWNLSITSIGDIRLTYEAIVKPDFFSPGYVIKRVLSNDFRKSLESIRKESQRRNNR